MLVLGVENQLFLVGAGRKAGCRLDADALQGKMMACIPPVLALV